MLVTLLGMVGARGDGEFWNAELPMLVSSLPRVRLASAFGDVLLNASEPMVVTVLGIVMLVILLSL